jgi:hypothetical protein
LKASFWEDYPPEIALAPRGTDLSLASLPEMLPALLEETSQTIYVWLSGSKLFYSSAAKLPLFTQMFWTLP